MSWEEVQGHGISTYPTDMQGGGDMQVGKLPSRDASNHEPRGVVLVNGTSPADRNQSSIAKTTHTSLDAVEIV